MDGARGESPYLGISIGRYPFFGDRELDATSFSQPGAIRAAARGPYRYISPLVSTRSHKSQGHT